MDYIKQLAKNTFKANLKNSEKELAGVLFCLSLDKENIPKITKISKELIKIFQEIEKLIEEQKSFDIPIQEG